MSSLPSASPWPVEILGGAKLAIDHHNLSPEAASVHLMPNGKTIVISLTPHVSSVYDGGGTEGGVNDEEHTFSDYGGPTSTVFLGELLADGSLLQISGDNESKGPLANYDENDLGYDWIWSPERSATDMQAGELVPGKSYARGFRSITSGLFDYFYPLGREWRQAKSWQHGNDLYFLWDLGMSCVMKLDTDTYDIEWVAGRGKTVGWDAKEQSKDNWRGLDADVYPWGSVAVDGDYAYWCEVSWKPISQEAFYGTIIEGNAYIQDQDSSRMMIRRMLLAPPYTVETLWDRTPAGYPNGFHVDVLDWAWSKNTATGLPNMYNPDALVNGGQSSTSHWYHTMAKGGYLYFLHGHSIRRWEIASGPNGDIETLLWGEKPWGHFYFEAYNNGLSENHSPRSHIVVSQSDLLYRRDHLCDTAGYPQGYPNGDKRTHDTPMGGEIGYEGMMTWINSPALSGDWMYFVNISSAYTAGSIQTMNLHPLTSYYPDNFASETHGTRICRINITELEKAGKPQRINREDPQWETIVNATVFDDQIMQHNKTGRSHLFLGTGNRGCFARFGDLTAYGDNVYFLAVDANLSLRDRIPDEYNGEIIYGPQYSYVVRAGGNFDYDLVLNFSGDAYQGYGERHELPQARMPKVLQ